MLLCHNPQPRPSASSAARPRPLAVRPTRPSRPPTAPSPTGRSTSRSTWPTASQRELAEAVSIQGATLLEAAAVLFLQNSLICRP